MAALAVKGHDVVGVSSKSTPIAVDISDPRSIASFYARIGKLDALISAAGGARFKPFAQLTDEDFAFSVRNKLMGQVNLVRLGLDHVNDGGSFTLTSGVLARTPMPGSGVISLVNAGLEGFTRAAALEAPRRIRVNIVSPPWVTETLVKFGMDPSIGLPAETVARAYVESVTGSQTGTVIDPRA
jgi:NAD(P)-dependent dehydrogenase (short-subunit alcohol dehydrogenase family)